MSDFKKRRAVLLEVAAAMSKGAKNAKRYREEIAILQEVAAEQLILDHLAQRMGQEQLHEVAGGAFTGHSAATEPVAVPETPPASTSGSGPLPLPDGEAEAALFTGELDIDNLPQGQVMP